MQFAPVSRCGTTTVSTVQATQGFGETATNTDPKDTADLPPSFAKGHPAPDHYHFQGHQAFLAGAGRQIPGDPRLMRIWLGLPGAATGISERIHAGAVVVNCHGRIDPLVGFSGGKG